MDGFRTLRAFPADQLRLNPDESRLVLRFIFDASLHRVIDNAEMTQHIRGFAQGLLVEAIDASYAIGFVQAVFRSTVNPCQATRTIIKSFAQQALSHWFSHATAADLLNVKIYDFVRAELGRRFFVDLHLLCSSIVRRYTGHSRFLSYRPVVEKHQLKVWG